ncbi:MAG: glycosyltransferase family 4 protein [Phycisphaerae bacterium]|nr:glycosyltransferase family 4 protein [Phycisphaerae bacterium]
MRVIYTFCGDLSGRPGGRLHFLAILRELAAQGHDVLALLPKYGLSKADMIPENENIRRVSLLMPPVRFANLLFQFVAALLLPAVILWFRPGVLMIRGTVGFWWLMAVIGRMFRVRVVAEINGIPWSEFRSRGKGKFSIALAYATTKAFCRSADTIITVTPGIGWEILRAIGRRRIRDVFVIQNGAEVNHTPPSRRSEIRRGLGIPESAFVVGYACSMDFWHSVDIIVRAYALLPDEVRREVHLLIFGNYTLPDSLSKDREHIHITGHIMPGQVREQLLCLDVAVLLSDCHIVSRHGFSSLKFWEYLAAGLPVIVQEDDNLSPMMRRFFSGTIIPKPTSEACAKAIVENNAHRKELSARGTATREQFEKSFTWTHVAKWVSWVLTKDDSWIRDFEPSHPCGRLETFPPSTPDNREVRG